MTSPSFADRVLARMRVSYAAEAAAAVERGAAKHDFMDVLSLAVSAHLARLAPQGTLFNPLSIPFSSAHHRKRPRAVGGATIAGEPSTVPLLCITADATATSAAAAAAGGVSIQDCAAFHAIDPADASSKPTGAQALLRKPAKHMLAPVRPMQVVTPLEWSRRAAAASSLLQRAHSSRDSGAISSGAEPAFPPLGVASAAMEAEVEPTVAVTVTVTETAETEEVEGVDNTGADLRQDLVSATARALAESDARLSAERPVAAGESSTGSSDELSSDDDCVLYELQLGGPLEAAVTAVAPSPEPDLGSLIEDVAPTAPPTLTGYAAVPVPAPPALVSALTSMPEPGARLVPATNYVFSTRILKKRPPAGTGVAALGSVLLGKYIAVLHGHEIVGGSGVVEASDSEPHAQYFQAASVKREQ